MASNIDYKECVGLEIETHLYLQYWQFFLVFSVTSQLPSLMWNIRETLSATNLDAEVRGVVAGLHGASEEGSAGGTHLFEEIGFSSGFTFSI